MVGFGYDIHKLSKDESLILGGIKIDSEYGTIAHSDGDVLIHAICDALLGAAGLQDIGEHFPDTDDKYKNADSTKFLQNVISLLHAENLKIVNVDATIVLEKPKLSSYKGLIKEKLSEIINIPKKRINIKATTNEQLDAIGNLDAIAVFCVCEVNFK